MHQYGGRGEKGVEGREEWRGEKSEGERGVKGESEGRWKRKRRGKGGER